METLLISLTPDERGEFHEPVIDAPQEVYEKFIETERGQAVLAGQESNKKAVAIEEHDGGPRFHMLARAPVSFSDQLTYSHYRTIFSTIMGLQQAASPEQRDPSIMLVPAVQPSVELLYPLRAQIAWPKSQDQALSDIVKRRMSEAHRRIIRTSRVHDFSGVRAEVSRRRGVFLSAQPQSKVATDPRQFRPADKYFKLAGERIPSYEFQMIYLIGLIALAHPEQFA